jgi:hypothetical protein
MDLLKTADAWLQKTRKAFVASPAIYQRVSSSVELRASYGRATYNIADSEGYQAVFESFDFLIDVVNLEIDDELIEPKVNDRIIVGDLDDGRVYEVINIPGGKCWQWASSFQLTFRVHTRFVGNQPPQR